MIKINLIVNNNNWLRFIKKPSDYIKKKVGKISRSEKKLDKKKIYLTLLLSDNQEIKHLNNKFRKKNKPTDVLSFPFQKKKEFKDIFKKEKEIYLGDIIINLDKVKNKNLKTFRSKFDQLWVHGLVHLFGYDHKKEKDFQKMSAIEKKYIDLIND